LANDAVVSLPCPACLTETKVESSRVHRSYAGNTVRRHRRCPACDLKFETIEQLFTRPSHTKLTPTQVSGIRIQYGRGVSQPELAKRYKVTLKTIWNIVNNATWTRPEVGAKK
jgi:transcriptional regulator NrdR family protein